MRRRHPILARARMLQGIDGRRRLVDEEPQDFQLEAGIPERVTAQVVEIDRGSGSRGLLGALRI